LEVKHRYLARQVGVLIEHPPENSMASLNFTSPVLDEGTMFNFGSWVCIANGSGGFNNHVANPKKPEASSPTSSCDIDNPADDLGRIKISNLIGSYASHIKANRRPSISLDDLIAGIDRWMTASLNASSSWKPLSISLTRRPRHETTLRLLTILLSPPATSFSASTESTKVS
jgi:hypothetical protein